MSNFWKGILYYLGFQLLAELFFYLGGPSYIGSIFAGIIMMFVNLIIVIVLGLWYRKSMGGYVSLKQVFLFLFTLMLLGNIESSLLNYSLFNFVDPELEGKVSDYRKQNMVEFMESVNAPEEAIDKALSEMDNIDYSSFDLVLRSIKGSIIVIAILSLILSFIFRRSPPVELEENAVNDNLN